MERITALDLPPTDRLVAAIEASTRCPKCGGAVRAVIRGAQDGDKVTSDVDVLASVYCAPCGWEARQWRPWSRHRPEEL